jgi:uncharacterized membrane protein
MRRRFHEFRQKAARHIRRRLLSGLLLLIPATATFFIMRLLFDFLLIFIRPWSAVRLGGIPPWGVSALAFFLLLVLVYLLGVVTTRVFGRRLLLFVETIVLRVPLVKSIYSGTKQILDTFRSTGQRAFKSVVIIEFPQPGCYGMGFVTSEMKDQDGRRILSVFLPTTPNPTSGYLLLIEESKAHRLSISVEEAVKMIISGGVVLPQTLGFPKPPALSAPPQPGV